MSIFVAIVIFGLLIFIHEFGHFIMAKKNGICVVEFSIGMGPNIFSFKRGETRYSLKLLPFGGACQMLNKELEGEELENADMERSFEAKSVWARMVVIAAGPAFNFILAFVLALVVMGVAGYDKPEVNYVVPNSAAEEAGLKVGDVITEYDGAGIDLAREIYIEQYANPVSEEKIKMTVLRDGKEVEITIKPTFEKKYALGIGYTNNDSIATISEVSKDGVMEKAGAKSGDVIKSINGKDIATGADLYLYFIEEPLKDKEIEIVLLRGKEEITLNVTPAFSSEGYVAGFSYNMYREETKGFDVIKYSFAEIKYQIKSVFKSLSMLFKGKLTVNDFTGPVGIVDIIDDVYEQSEEEGLLSIFLNLSNISILLSASLGVMNLLPIPGLDGGRLLFLIYEAIVGKPVKREEYIHLAGLLLLMLFAVYIMFKDISKLF